MKTYIRKGQSITTIDGDKESSEDFGSINKAKKKSRILQLTSKRGFLGCGVLTVTK